MQTSNSTMTSKCWRAWAATADALTIALLSCGTN